MKQFLIFLLSLTSFSPLFSQVVTDEEKSTLLQELNKSRKYRKTNLDSALISCQQLLSNPRLPLYDSIYAETLRHKGLILKRTNRDSSYFYYGLSLAIAERIKDSAIISSTLMNSASLYNSEGKNSISDSLITIARNYALGDSKKLVSLTLNQINTKIGLGRYAQAIQLAEEAIEICKQNKLNKYLKMLYGQIGNIYFQLEDYNSSLDNYKKAIGEKPYDRTDIPYLNSIASCYLDMDSTGLTRFYLDQALQLNPNNSSLEIIYYNYSGSYIKEENFELAQKYIDKFHSDIDKPTSGGICVLDIQRNQIHYKKGNYEAFLKSYPSSMECLEKMGMLAGQKDITRNAIYASSRVNVRTLLDKYDMLNDSLKSNAQKRLITNADIRASRIEDLIKNQKLKEINSLTESNLKNQKKITLLSLMGVMGFSILSYLLYRLSIKRKEATARISEQKNQIELLHNEAQHRSKNQIALAIGLVTNSDDPERNKSRLQALAQVNELLNTPVSQKMKFSKLINSIVEANIFSLSDKEIQLDNEINGLEIGLSQVTPISLILNELSINSIKHAFIDESSPKISIVQDANSDFIKFIYSDNGKGIVKHQKLSDSQGTDLIEGLVHQLQGSSEIKSNNGFKFVLKIPRHEQ